MLTPTFVSIAPNNSGNSAKTVLTISNVVVTGNLLMVFVGYNGGSPTVSTLKWNTTENLTLLDVRSSGSSPPVGGEIWYLKNPTKTTADVVITMTGEIWSILGWAVDIDKADVTGTTFSDVAAHAGSSVNRAVDVTVTTVVDQLVIDVMSKRYTDVTDGVLVQNAGQTLRDLEKNSISEGTNISYGGISTKVATTTSTNMGWSWTTNNRSCTLQAVGINGLQGLPNIKSINGIAAASIKTVNGISVASIKSIQGL